MPVDLEFKVDCFLCKQSFPFGFGVYRGRPIPAWKITVCDTCYKGNWDGVVLELHPRLKDHLKDKKIEIIRNEKGWVDWPT